MFLLYLLVISAVYKVFLLFFSTPCLSFEVYCTNFWSNAVFLHNHLGNICYSLKNFCYKNHYMLSYYGYELSDANHCCTIVNVMIIYCRGNTKDYHENNGSKGANTFSLEESSSGIRRHTYLNQLS